MYGQLGADVIGMTQFPEAILARELELCFGTVALVTDYDVGVDDIPPVTHEEVLKVFGENIDKLRDTPVRGDPRGAGGADVPVRDGVGGHGQRMTARRSAALVTVELRFVTEDDPEQLADRMREAVATIVGQRRLEEFRVKPMPLEGLQREGRSPRRRVTAVTAAAGGPSTVAAMLFRRKLPRSSFVLLSRWSRALLAALAMRAYAHRLDVARPTAVLPRTSSVVTAPVPRGSVLTETVLEIVTLPARFAPVGASGRLGSRDRSDRGRGSRGRRGRDGAPARGARSGPTASLVPAGHAGGARSR